MQIDDGVLSVASEKIIHDLNVSESQLGLVEAAMYIGILIGSIVCPFMFAHGNPKVIIIVAVLCTSAAVATWSVTGTFWILVASRVLDGIFLVSNSEG